MEDESITSPFCHKLRYEVANQDHRFVCVCGGGNEAREEDTGKPSLIARFVRLYSCIIGVEAVDNMM
jgi:hypothetical protein